VEVGARWKSVRCGRGTTDGAVFDKPWISLLDLLPGCGERRLHHDGGEGAHRDQQ
jgi:hypothetical protein